MDKKKRLFCVFTSVNVHLYMCCDVKCQIRQYDQRLIITQLDYQSESRYNLDFQRQRDDSKRKLFVLYLVSVGDRVYVHMVYIF